LPIIPERFHYQQKSECSQPATGAFILMRPTYPTEFETAHIDLLRQQLTLDHTWTRCFPPEKIIYEYKQTAVLTITCQCRRVAC